MVKVKQDLTNMRFGKLVVMYQVEDHLYPNKTKRAKWHCKCDCGNEIDVVSISLKSGATQSCGCLQNEQRIKNGKLNKKYNKYDLTNKYGIGWTSNTNKEFCFDLEDYDLIKNYCWFEHRGYVEARALNKSKVISMQKLILDYFDDMVIDHINHNTLDNRKSNLRICTIQQNNMNKKIAKNNSSGYSGVYFDKRRQKWCAYIGVDNQIISLGFCFNNIKEAINARKEAEMKYFGEFRILRKEDNEYGC